MEKDFVPYEQALALKELGFNETCMGYYSNREFIYGSHTNNEMQRFRYSAPTYSQAFRWFREKYHIHGEPFYKGGLTKQTSWYDYRIYSTIDWTNTNPKQQWKKYPEAELACLTKLIEIVEGIES